MGGSPTAPPVTPTAPSGFMTEEDQLQLASRVVAYTTDAVNQTLDVDGIAIVPTAVLASTEVDPNFWTSV
jgi:hypothetical protein